VQVLTEAAEHCPEHAEVQLRLGFLQMQRKKWTPALDAFRRAAALSPKDADIHLYLAVLYGDHLEMPAQARQHLEEYQRLGGSEPSALRWLEELKAK
jgi:Flp pilus assembly protein TadD